MRGHSRGRQRGEAALRVRGVGGALSSLQVWVPSLHIPSQNICSAGRRKQGPPSYGEAWVPALRECRGRADGSSGTTTTGWRAQLGRGQAQWSYGTSTAKCSRRPPIGHTCTRPATRLPQVGYTCGPHALDWGDTYARGPAKPAGLSQACCGRGPHGPFPCIP